MDKSMLKKIVRTVKFESDELDWLFGFAGGACAECGKSCCCADCGRCKGFFEDSDITKVDDRDNFFLFLKKTYGFRKHRGFLRKKGCALPRALRSKICLIHTCRSMDDMLREKNPVCKVGVGDNEIVTPWYRYLDLLCYSLKEKRKAIVEEVPQ